MLTVTVMGSLSMGYKHSSHLNSTVLYVDTVLITGCTSADLRRQSSEYLTARER